MSRWSRKSDEEKKIIHQEQLKKAQGQKDSYDVVTTNFKKKAGRMQSMIDDKDKWTRIVNAGDLPILCPIDGWVGCRTYKLKNKTLTPGASEYLVAEGNCRICQRPIAKSINAWDSDAIIIMQLIRQLESEGRLIDTREKKD